MKDPIYYGVTIVVVVAVVASHFVGNNSEPVVAVLVDGIQNISPVVFSSSCSALVSCSCEI